MVTPVEVEATRAVASGMRWFSSHLPIGTYWQQPLRVGVPTKMLLPEYRGQLLLVAVAEISNCSSHVLSNIRVRLPFVPDIEIEPTLDALDASWAFDAQSREIRIDRLDPRARARFALHMTPSAFASGHPSFIVQDRLVSWQSRLRASFHGASWPERAAFCFLGLVTAAMVFAMSATRQTQADYDHKSKLMTQTGARPCEVEILTKANGSLTYAGLQRNKLGGAQGAVSLNSGRDIDELLSRAEAWICRKLLED